MLPYKMVVLSQGANVTGIPQLAVGACPGIVLELGSVFLVVCTSYSWMQIRAKKELFGPGVM